MNYLKAFIFGLFLIIGCSAEEVCLQVSLSKETTSDFPATGFFSELRDTVFTQNKYGDESSVFLGKLIVKSEEYNVYTLFRKVQVADGYRGSSFLVFEKKPNEIRYQVMSGDLSRIVSIKQNKLIISDDVGESRCLEEIDSFPDEMVFGCDIGLLVLQKD